MELRIGCRLPCAGTSDIIALRPQLMFVLKIPFKTSPQSLSWQRSVVIESKRCAREFSDKWISRCTISHIVKSGH